MNNKILALKYRPHFFNEVIGQEFCIQSLSNSIKLNKIHNAYLFSGTRGVGKTTIARIFAKSLLCKEGISETPCGKCESCVEIDNNNNLDLIEIDAASRTKVEDTRTLMENVQYAPTSSRFKIYLIDEVHMLSTKSFNALLKTIEEPPEHVKFLLATTEPEKLPETVISRCLHFKLETIGPDALSTHIESTLKKENIKYDSETPEIIANAARGSARDSMSILEQCISYGNGHLQKNQVSQLLGVVENTLIDSIIHHLHKNAISDIQHILNNQQITNYYKLLDSLIERIFEISIVRTTNNNSFEIPDKFLQESIKLQDLQLWYSILLQSKEQLNNAPSKLDHILMTLLRITLFTEYSDNSTHEDDSIQEQSIKKTESKKKNKKNTLNISEKSNFDLSIWKGFVDSQSLHGLMLDLANNSLLDSKDNVFTLVVDKSKKNTYPKKCINDFCSLVCTYFKINADLAVDGRENIYTLYKQSINENIKSKNDMYQSIKDNTVLKDIEDVFDGKIDKDKISKL